MNKTGMLAALIAFSGIMNANAEALEVRVDGCAELARLVYAEVQSSALYGPSRSGPWVIGSERSDVHVCETASKTVSKAFTLAMASVGQYVNWPTRQSRTGDACLSAFLSQCYPSPREPWSVITADRDLIMKSWSVVSQSVMREMYNPYSSDEVRFRSGELRLRMGLSLRSVHGRHMAP